MINKLVNYGHSVMSFRGKTMQYFSLIQKKFWSMLIKVAEFLLGQIILKQTYSLAGEPLL